MMDTDAEGLQTRAAMVGEPVRPAVADAGDHAAVERARGSVRDAHGHVDTLVSNAGLLSGNGAEETPPEERRRPMAINLDAAFHLARARLPGPVRTKGVRNGKISGWCGFRVLDAIDCSDADIEVPCYRAD